jgi:hypothetical protein
MTEELRPDSASAAENRTLYARNHYALLASQRRFELTVGGSISLYFIQDLLGRCFTPEPRAKIGKRKDFVPVVLLWRSIFVQNKTILLGFHALILAKAGAIRTEFSLRRDAGQPAQLLPA